MSKVLIQGDWLDGFSSGKKAALLDWSFRREQRSFERLIKILRATKWNKEHPERRKQIAREHAARVRAEHREEQNAEDRAKRAARYRGAPVLFTCAHCGVTWCKTPWTRGKTPRFCSTTCWRTWRYRNDEAFRAAQQERARRSHAHRRGGGGASMNKPRDEWSAERERQRQQRDRGGLLEERLSSIDREPVDRRVRELGGLVDEMELGL